MSLPEALKRGALAFFGDKYNPEEVRLIEIPHFSVELCGGTHVSRTGDIGTFKIVEVSALSAGHRRIVAFTGPRALELYQEVFGIVKQISTDFKVKREEVIPTIIKVKDELKQTQSQIKQLKKSLFAHQIPNLIQQATMIGSLPVVLGHFDDATINDLRELTPLIAQKQPGLIILTSIHEDRGLFFASMSDQFINTFNLNEFASFLKDELGVQGGISKNIIQGSMAKFDASFKDKIISWLKRQ